MFVRVRFAPSPTGLLHIGALRTVLFDHLFARRHQGVNILRIEDTDRSRYNADSEQEFVETLRWVGIDFDEGPHVGGPNGPYRQSERKEAGIYDHWIERLIELGHAYRAFESPEELEEMREYQQINKQPIGYFGGNWRDASASKVDAALAEGRSCVVRQRVPRDRKIVMQDAIRGRIEYDSNTLPDPVLIKGDGMPTYHFAAMVDDHLMGITHIFRGEEWIPSFPFHWLLFEQFGWEPPIFVHCPVIVGTDGKKLSKRHGATRVLDYAARGYLKDALKNFIALIGWSPGDDREVMAEEELIAAFSIEGLQPSPGRFDIEKLDWLNGVRIRSLGIEDLLGQLLDYISTPYTREFWASFVDAEPIQGKAPIDGSLVWTRLERIVEAAERDRSYLLAALNEEQQRVSVFYEFGEALEFFLVDEPPMDAKAVEKWFRLEHVRSFFNAISAGLPTPGADPTAYEALVRGYAASSGFEKLGPVVHPLRIALTGKTFGPGLFELMSVLGPSRIERRLERAIAMLDA